MYAWPAASCAALSGIGIALCGFLNHKLRSGEVESVPGSAPPLASHLLTGYDHDIT